MYNYVFWIVNPSFWRDEERDSRGMRYRIVSASRGPFDKKHTTIATALLEESCFYHNTTHHY
jgi:hypothetical protein